MEWKLHPNKNISCFSSNHLVLSVWVKAKFKTILASSLCKVGGLSHEIPFILAVAAQKQQSPRETEKGGERDREIEREPPEQRDTAAPGTLQRHAELNTANLSQKWIHNKNIYFNWILWMLLMQTQSLKVWSQILQGQKQIKTVVLQFTSNSVTISSL